MNSLRKRIFCLSSNELKSKFIQNKVEFRRRGDYKLLHCWLYILDLIWPSHKEKFSIAQGKTIYLTEDVANNVYNKMGIIRHELQHVLQWSLWFMLCYVLSRKWRVIYEVEGYAQNMLEKKEKDGRVPLSYMVMIHNTISANYFLVTNGMRDYCYKCVLRAGDMINSGELEGYDSTNLRKILKDL